MININVNGFVNFNWDLNGLFFGCWSFSIGFFGGGGKEVIFLVFFFFVFKVVCLFNKKKKFYIK